MSPIVNAARASVGSAMAFARGLPALVAIRALTLGFAATGAALGGPGAELGEAL